MKNRFGECNLCLRPDLTLTTHHLTPRDEGGRFMPKTDLCVQCHKQLHALYSNKELASRLNTIEQLKEDDKIRKYLKWVRKQSPSSLVNVKKSSNRRNH